jgi:predicted aldo/keto reductase-like oxidoreductase
MLYRKAPKSGDKLSILGFGCMRLPQKEGRIDEDRAAHQIRRAIDGGVNYIDTAWPYHGGQSEPFVGRVLAGGYRERVRLATKLPTWLVADRTGMDRFLDAQLERLAVSHIDYYLIHSLAGDRWDRIAALGAADFLDRAKTSGKIKNAGFSYHGHRNDFGRVVDAYPWDFCQIQYNYLDEERQAGTGGLRYAASKGLAVMVMEPLRGGGLAASPQPIDALWRESGRPWTAAEWALRWVWDHPEVTVVLSGMNDEVQVEENLRIAGDACPGSLTTADLDVIARIVRKYREIMKVGCTGCGYCQPCPSGVDIPGAFEVFNSYHAAGKPYQLQMLYVVRAGGVLSGTPTYASLCSRCMDCIEKCPQGLPIPNLLEDVAAEFEGRGLQEREELARRIFGK